MGPSDARGCAAQQLTGQHRVSPAADTRVAAPKQGSRIAQLVPQLAQLRDWPRRRLSGQKGPSPTGTRRPRSRLQSERPLGDDRTLSTLARDRSARIRQCGGRAHRRRVQPAGANQQARDAHFWRRAGKTPIRPETRNLGMQVRAPRQPRRLQRARVDGKPGQHADRGGRRHGRRRGVPKNGGYEVPAARW
jgi:hypothetical protein